MYFNEIYLFQNSPVKPLPPPPMVANGICPHQRKQMAIRKVNKENRQQDLEDALTFGNHKGASAQPALLKNSSKKYSSMDTACQFPNTRVSNGTNEHHGAKYNEQLGNIFPKD
jgi:hypothetical protein